MKRALSILLVSSTAWADAVSEEAEKKFNDGVKAMDDGKYDVACPLFAESYRLEPLPGALFTLAECESKWGKMATALGHYEQYLQQYEKMNPQQKNKSASRAKVASSQIEALGPEVPEIALALAAGAPDDVVVKRDNIIVPLAQLSTPVRLDPGEHVFVVETSDGRSKETKVKVAVGEKRKLELQVPEKKTDETRPDIFHDDGSKKSGGSLLPVTITVGAVGIAGVAVGAITGIVALGDKSTADQNCMGLGCNQKGLAAVKDGQTMGWVSTIGFIAGGVCLAAAVVLFAMEPKKQKTGFVTPFFARF